MSEQLLQQILGKLNQFDARFNQIDERFAQMDARFDQIDERFAQMDARFDQMDLRITNEINGIREDIAAFRKETSQAFVETHNKIDDRAKELQDQLDKHKRVLEALSLRSLEQETEIRDIKRIK